MYGRLQARSLRDGLTDYMLAHGCPLCPFNALGKKNGRGRIGVFASLNAARKHLMGSHPEAMQMYAVGKEVPFNLMPGHPVGFLADVSVADVLEEEAMEEEEEAQEGLEDNSLAEDLAAAAVAEDLWGPQGLLGDEPLEDDVGDILMDLVRMPSNR